MVETRSSARLPPPPSADQGDSSDSSESSIPHRPVPRRKTPIGTPATLRPSKTPTVSKPVSTKRKREEDEVNGEGSIEVQGEDDLVGDALKATSARPKANKLVVPLYSSGDPRRRGGPSANATSRPSTTEAGALGGPSDIGGWALRLKRLKRHVRSVELFGGSKPVQRQRRDHKSPVPAVAEKTPEPETQEGDEIVVGGGSPEHMDDSPELQSSALKRRPQAERPVDVYAFPDDSPSPTAARRPATINGLRAKQDRLQRRPQENSRLSPVREQEQPPLYLDDEDRQFVEHELETEAAQNNHEEPDEPEGETEDSESEAEEAHARAAVSDGFEIPEFVPIAVRPYTENERTIPVLSDHLTSMSDIMGKSGWTGLGGRWRHRLTGGESELPIQTRLGKRLFNSLGFLLDELDELPNAFDLAIQSRCLEKQHSQLNHALSSVEKLVRRVEGLAVQGDQATTDFPWGSLEDLLTHIVPMIVMVLRVAFAMGVTEPADAMVRDALPEEGVFTWTTVQYLMNILAWLPRLEKVMTLELSRWPDADVADEQQDLEEAKRNREEFWVMARKWRQQVRHEVDKFNAQVDRARELSEMRERDERIKAQRRRQEEEERERKEKQEQAFYASLREIARQPRPLAMLFHNGDGDSVVRSDTPRSRPQSSRPQSSRPQPSRSQPSRRQSSRPRSSISPPRRLVPPPRSSPAPPAPPPPPPPPPARKQPPWSEEDRVWFLEQLNEPDRPSDYLEVCVDSFGRTVEDLLAEKERLKRTGRYRSPSPVERRRRW